MEKHFESIHNRYHKETKLDEKMSYDQHHTQVEKDIYNISNELLKIESEELNEFFNIVEKKKIFIRDEANFDKRDENPSKIKNINKDSDKFNIKPKEAIPDNAEVKLNEKEQPIEEKKGPFPCKLSLISCNYCKKIYKCKKYLNLHITKMHRCENGDHS